MSSEKNPKSLDEMSLSELFKEADRVGSHYQTAEENKALKDKLARLAAEIETEEEI